jgi:hypothetical protein
VRTGLAPWIMAVPVRREKPVPACGSSRLEAGAPVWMEQARSWPSRVDEAGWKPALRCGCRLDGCLDAPREDCACVRMEQARNRRSRMHGAGWKPALPCGWSWPEAGPPVWMEQAGSLRYGPPGAPGEPGCARARAQLRHPDPLARRGSLHGKKTDLHASEARPPVTQASSLHGTKLICTHRGRPPRSAGFQTARDKTSLYLVAGCGPLAG